MPVIVYACMFICVCRGQRTTLDVVLQVPPTLILRQSLLPPYKLAWLTSSPEMQLSPTLSADPMGVQHHSQLFYNMGSGVQTQVLLSLASSLLSDHSSSSSSSSLCVCTRACMYMCAYWGAGRKSCCVDQASLKLEILLRQLP